MATIGVSAAWEGPDWQVEGVMNSLAFSPFNIYVDGSVLR